MSVTAIGDYPHIVKDSEANFHGNWVVYIGWDHHLMFCSTAAFALAPQTSFQSVIDEVLPGHYGLHPDFQSIDWNRVQWLRDGEPFVPQMDATLADNGVGHKTLVRFATPELNGIQGSGS